MTAHSFQTPALTGRADELLARLDHVIPHDGDGLAAVARERGWVEAIRHFAARGLLTPEGTAEAAKLLSATAGWVAEQDDDLDPPVLPPLAADGNAGGGR